MQPYGQIWRLQLRQNHKVRQFVSTTQTSWCSLLPQVQSCLKHADTQNQISRVLQYFFRLYFLSVKFTLSWVYLWIGYFDSGDLPINIIGEKYNAAVPFSESDQNSNKPIAEPRFPKKDRKKKQKTIQSSPIHATKLKKEKYSSVNFSTLKAFISFLALSSLARVAQNTQARTIICAL
mmetsp:Transcript_6152/g.6917  ORF Transcript_6152/g.6917 Transcript_6152/m.6917 type:complete len:178 (-) Transcript_6152:25-558(-)